MSERISLEFVHSFESFDEANTHEISVGRRKREMRRWGVKACES